MNKKSRNLMYVQQLQHLKINLDDLKSILNNSDAIRWAYIVHDEDKSSKDNMIATKHIHIALQFKNARYASAISKKFFKDSPERVQYWDAREGNLWSYLIHDTKDAAKSENKHKYSFKDVTANFDFEAELKKIEVEVKRSKVKNVKPFLQQYAENLISREDLIKKIGLYNFANHKRQIDTITELLSEEHHKKWRETFKGPCKVIWIYGPSGIGKSTYTDYLVKDDVSIAKLGSSNDYFQNYNGQHTCILNDLRPNDIKYADLLRLLDPWQLDKETPRRYHNRYFDAEKIYITTPYSINDFYRNSYIPNKEIDTLEQLKRRVSKEIQPNQIISEMKKHHLGKYKND